MFTIKLSSSGQLKWLKICGGQFADQGTAIRTDNSSNCYVTGYFQSQATFDTNYVRQSNGFSDNYLLKYDSSGNILWLKTFGTFGASETVNAMATNSQGALFLTGSAADTMYIDTARLTIPRGNTNIWVIRLDSLGQYYYSKAYGGTAIDVGYGIECDASGYYYLTGVFRDTCRFGQFFFTSSGSSDIFQTRVDNFLPIVPGVKRNILSPITVNIYPNPASDKVLIRIEKAGFVPDKAILYTLNGRQLNLSNALIHLSETEFQLPFSGLEGYHILELSSATQISRTPFIIKNNR